MAQSEIKEFFETCRRIDHRINALIADRDRKRALACKMTAGYSDMPRSGAGPRSPFEDAIVKVMELEAELTAEIDQMTGHRDKAKEIIAAIPDNRYRDILTWRYFGGYKWDDIADMMGHERMWVWRLHGEALTAAKNIFEEIA